MQVLSEVMHNVADQYAGETGQRVAWATPKPWEEIRTMFINWSTVAHPPHHDPAEKLHTYLKPTRKFEAYGANAFGLRVGGKDTHHPVVYMLLKTRHLAHAARHPRSAEGQIRGKKRRNSKTRAKAKAKAAAKA